MVSCLQLLVFVVPLIAKVEARKPFLNFIVTAPLPDMNNAPDFDGRSIIPAVKLAVEQINSRTDILPNFDINTIRSDSGCEVASRTAVGVVRVLRDLFVSRDEPPTGFIGPACPEDSAFVVNTFQFFFYIPVLYSATTPFLSSHDDKRSIAYGMVSSTEVLVETLIGVASKEKWNWENIAILYDDSREHFHLTFDVLIKALNDSHSVGYVQRISPSQIPLNDIIERNIRIVVVISDTTPAQQLVCLAGQPSINFVFPIYQFIFMERSLDDFLKISNKKGFSFAQLRGRDGRVYHCNEETMIRGLDGSIFLIQSLDSVPSEVVTVSNYTVAQVKAQYRMKLDEYQEILHLNLSESKYAYSYYDAVWVLALGLHRAIQRHKPTLDILHSEIETNVSFQGVSSWIDFKHRRQVSNPVHIFQVNGSEVVIRGMRNGSVLEYEPETFISDKFVTENLVIHHLLAVMGLILATVLFMSTLVMQILTVVYRNSSSVKASSVHLNHFIYLGCYLFVAAIITNTLHHILPAGNGQVLCNLDVFSSIFASCFIASTVLVKLWRTYRIFNYVFKTARAHRFALHNGMLATVIVVLNLIQVVLCIPALIVSPFEESTTFIYDNAQRPPIRRIKTKCSVHSIGYIAIPVLFQLCLALASILLATLNRNVKRKHFRTTKQVVILIYILTITWAIGGSLLAIFYYSNFSVNVTYSFYVCLVVATIVLCQVMLIVPSLVPLITGREGSRPT